MDLRFFRRVFAMWCFTIRMLYHFLNPFDPYFLHPDIIDMWLLVDRAGATPMVSPGTSGGADDSCATTAIADDQV